MAEAPAIKRRGNPNFGKQQSREEIEYQKAADDLNKLFIFQLTRTHEKSKPRDGKTGDLVGSPYQPYYAVVNSGVAWDKDYIPPSEEKKPVAQQRKGAARRWRYLATYPTIWVDEQVDPLPTREDLAAPENDLTFRQGVLVVKGHETMKLQALKLNNAFAGVERPLKNVPQEYVLLDQEKIDKQVLQDLDDAFEAEASARKATLDEMYAVGYFFGIDMSKSDDAIRKEFINIARTRPAVFNREFVNPKNKYKYTFLEALADNLISTSVIPGKITWVETNVAIVDVRTPEPAEELASMVVANQEKVVNLYNRIKKHYETQE